MFRWGGPESLFLWGGPRSLFLWGGPGSLFLWGGPGSLFLWGGPRSLFIWGGPGSLFLWGGPRSLFLWGGPQSLFLWDGPGSLFLWGGPGSSSHTTVMVTFSLVINKGSGLCSPDLCSPGNTSKINESARVQGPLYSGSNRWAKYVCPLVLIVSRPCFLLLFCFCVVCVLLCFSLPPLPAEPCNEVRKGTANSS